MMHVRLSQGQRTPLYMSANNGSIEVSKLLLEAAAAVDARNKASSSPDPREG